MRSKAAASFGTIQRLHLVAAARLPLGVPSVRAAGQSSICGLFGRAVGGWLVVVSAAIAISSVKCAKAAPLSNGLVAYWQFENSGEDSAANDFDLQIVGGPPYAGGRFGQGLALTGDISQFARRPGDDAAFDFGSNPFSVQTWIKLTDNTREQTIIEKFSGSAGPGWTLTARPNRGGGDIQFYTDGASSLAVPVSNFATGVWHHLLVSRGDRLSLFVDGVVRRISGDGSISDVVRPLLLGRRNDADGRGFGLRGVMDEVAVWSRALSDAEALALFNGGAGRPVDNYDPPPADPAVRWSGNGHVYEFVPAQGISWPDAEMAARSRRRGNVAGHLATIGSQGENDFVVQLLSKAGADLPRLTEAWIGAQQLDPQAPASDGWSWTTGEPWLFTAWDFDEPNDNAGGEQYLGMWGPHGDGPLGRWNDQGGPADHYAVNNIQGYIIEFPVPEPHGALLAAAASCIVLAGGPTAMRRRRSPRVGKAALGHLAGTASGTNAERGHQQGTK